MTKFVVKRIYEPADQGDGYRTLVDRLWPRGVSRERAALDEWARAIAPSDELRKWYGHDPAKRNEFAHRYIDEIEKNPAADGIVANWRQHDTVTLLYGARDTEGNEAVVLEAYLRSRET